MLRYVDLNVCLGNSLLKENDRNLKKIALKHFWGCKYENHPFVFCFCLSLQTVWKCMCFWELLGPCCVCAFPFKCGCICGVFVLWRIQTNVSCLHMPLRCGGIHHVFFDIIGFRFNCNYIEGISRQYMYIYIQTGVEILPM